MKFENDFSIAYIQKRNPVWNLAETILLTLLLILLTKLIHPADPFSLAGPIPWIVFAPIFCSLFYGAMYGVASLVIVLGLITFQLPTDVQGNHKLLEYIIGSMGFTFLAGVFSSYWLAHIRQVEHLNNYVREHMDNLSREYYLLRISHERIEQAYIIKPLSLRDAFFQIKEDIANNNCEINRNSGLMLLEVFSQFCSINNAAFCIYDETKKEIRPLAFLGKEFSVSIDDQLIQSAIKLESSTYVSVNHFIKKEISDYIAIIPLFGIHRKTMGFIVIKDMPFWSLTHDTLEVLTVFAAYFALYWSNIKHMAPLLQEFPTASAEFLGELQTLADLKKYNNIESSLTCIIIPPEYSQQNIAYILERQKRSLDYIWIHTAQSHQFVVTLLPLTGMEGILGYRKRIATLLKSEFGLILNDNGLNLRFRQLNQQSASKQLHDFIEETTRAAN